MNKRSSSKVNRTFVQSYLVFNNVLKNIIYILFMELFSKNILVHQLRAGSSSSFAFKGTHTQTVCFSSPSKRVNFNILYKNICGVFWAKTSHTHSGDIKNLFYILWKGHYTSPLMGKLAKCSYNIFLLAGKKHSNVKTVWLHHILYNLTIINDRGKHVF